MIPPIKLDLENIDPILTKFGYFILVGFIFFFVFFAGYLSNSSEKSVVCRRYIKENTELLKQLETCQGDYAKLEAECQLDCIKREKEICTEEKEVLKENIKNLRCEICQRGGVQ